MCLYYKNPETLFESLAYRAAAAEVVRVWSLGILRDCLRCPGAGLKLIISLFPELLLNIVLREFYTILILHYLMFCCITLCYVFISCYVIAHHAISCHIPWVASLTLFDIVLNHIMLCYILLCYTMLEYVALYSITRCNIILQ